MFSGLLRRHRGPCSVIRGVMAQLLCPILLALPPLKGRGSPGLDTRRREPLGAPWGLPPTVCQPIGGQAQAKREEIRKTAGSEAEGEQPRAAAGQA